MLQDGCCHSTDTYEFEYFSSESSDEEMLVIANYCIGKDPKFYISQTKSSRYEETKYEEKEKYEDEPKPKNFMVQNQFDGDA
jgi:hypothetical protein